LRHEAGTDQHLDMARYRLQRNLERRRQLGYQQVFAIELVEYLPSDRIGERAKHQVEGRFRRFDGIHGTMITRIMDYIQ
jgi:hypothetical protein